MLALDETAVRFFRNEFYGSFSETKEQIKARVYTILKSRELDTIFNDEECLVDWYDVVQESRIVLVNTARDVIGKEASQILGRYVIASIDAATSARRSLPDNQKPPVFLYIDEAQLYVDEMLVPEMLTLARDSCLGVTLAHQGYGQFDQSTQSAIKTNSSTKYAASLGPDDLRIMAGQMRCDESFIEAQRIRDGDVHFACWCRRLRP